MRTVPKQVKAPKAKTDSITEKGWIVELLDRMGAPETMTNVDDMAHWMSMEEPWDDWWDRNNPLNTSWGAGDTAGLNSYPDLTAGNVATANTIEQTNMAPVLAALMKGDVGATAFGTAVESTPWASGHYDGENFASSPLSGLGLSHSGTGDGSAAGTGPTSTTAPTAASTVGLFSSATGDIEKVGGYVLAISAGAALIAFGIYKTVSPTPTKGKP